MPPTRSRTSLFVLAGLIAALGVGAGIGATAFAVLSDDSTSVVREVTVGDSQPTAAADGLSIGTIYENAGDGVVEITTTGGSTFNPQQAQGSGFVFDEEGHVVTNQHVVEGANTITVRFRDGTTRSARLLGSDGSTDLAVIKVSAPDSLLEPLRLADSDDVEVGDDVLAMGSPFGLEGTITRGIVSALHRQMTAPNRFTINDTIQTDAAINHGNSGGPLLDNRGLVIGVNAQIESNSGGSDGVGFAIPSNTVQSVVTQIVETGAAEHAYLGVVMVDVAAGVAVTQVPDGTPASKAGLRAATGERTVEGQRVPTGGDVIVEFDGKPIATSGELQGAVESKRPGDTVEVTVIRGGDRKTVEITLGERPENPQ